MDCTICRSINPDGAFSCADCGASLQPGAITPVSSVPLAAATAPASPATPIGWQPVPAAAVPTTQIPVAPQPLSAAFAPLSAAPLAGLASGNTAMPAPASFPAFAPAGAVLSTGFTVIVERGGRAVLEVPLTKESVILGRSDVDASGMPVFPDVDLSAHDPEMIASRRHAALILENGALLLEDLGSANGTFLENVGKLLPGQRQPLPLGTRFMLGRGGPAIYCRA